MDSLRLFIVPSAYSLSQLYHLLDSVWLKEVFVVEMIEQDVQPFLGIVDLGFERRRCFRFHSLHVLIENFVDWLSVDRYVRSIARS